MYWMWLFRTGVSSPRILGAGFRGARRPPGFAHGAWAAMRAAAQSISGPLTPSDVWRKKADVGTLRIGSQATGTLDPLRPPRDQEEVKSRIEGLLLRETVPRNSILAGLSFAVLITLAGLASHTRAQLGEDKGPLRGGGGRYPILRHHALWVRRWCRANCLAHVPTLDAKARWAGATRVYRPASTLVFGTAAPSPVDSSTPRLSSRARIPLAYTESLSVASVALIIPLLRDQRARVGLVKRRCNSEPVSRVARISQSIVGHPPQVGVLGTLAIRQMASIRFEHSKDFQCLLMFRGQVGFVCTKEFVPIGRTRNGHQEKDGAKP